MRRLSAAATVLVASLACAVGVATGADIGANDDTGKWTADGGASFFAAMAATGLHQTIMSVRWQPGDDREIAYRARLDAAVGAATAAGLRVVLAVYPYPAREIESGQAKPWAFADYVRRVAERYPQVRQFVIGNEPNQPAFWRPQFSRRTGANVSAKTFGAYLAAAYDALKARDPAITVVGVGLSPRGNDRPRAKSNVSTSPMRFLAALGRWYRASGRTAPLMDGFSFHPYPSRATDPVERGYPWPHAGLVNLDRVKQALWDAFAGTPQPTTVDGLKLYLDEVGWQVDTNRLPGYEGLENVPVTDEATQAAIYREVVRLARCDADIAEANFFGFYDDGLRTGFQAALHRVDGTPRPSAQAVRDAIADPAPVCSSAAPWQPQRSVVGVQSPSVTVSGRIVTVEARSGEGAKLRLCALPRAASTVSALRALQRVQSRGSAAACRTTRVTPQHPARISISRQPTLARGGTIALKLTAEANDGRTVSFVTRFR